MADIRINALATTAASTASDDFIAIDGSANGTRKLNAYSPTFGGNLTVSGTGTSSVAGSLGIGTTSPTRPLDVRGSLGMQVNEDNAGTKVISIRSDFASAGPAINVTTNDPLLFLTNNSERARITSSGNLGIGTPTPSRKLSVVVSGTGNVATFESNAGPNIEFKGTESSGRTYLIGEGLVTAGNFSIYDSTGSAERLVVASSGNLLLKSDGVDSSNGKLQLATHTTSAGGIGFGTDTSFFRNATGRITLGRNDSTNAAYLRFAYNTSTSAVEIGSIGAQNTVLYIDSLESGGSTQFRTNGTTTALTLDSSQNATFAGTIAIYGASTADTLKITRASNSANGMLKFITTSTEDWIVGQRNISDSDFHFYSYGISGDALKLERSTGNATFAGAIAIGNTVNTVSPTSPNRTITMVIGGTTYYLHAKTTND